MDLPPPVQEPERREEAGEGAGRPASVEAELIALGARLEQLEASLQQAVREETRRASNEIRHTVSELGRRLALDLPQFLDRHRQLIVAELRGGAPAEPGATGPGEAPAAAASAPVAGEQPPLGPADETDTDGSSNEAGGARRKRRRRKEG
jgi:hypothetical protein